MLLDITLLVDAMRGDAGARLFLEAQEEGGAVLRVPAPVLARVAEGMARSRSPPRDAERIREALLRLPEAPFTARHAMRAGDILGRLAPTLDPFDAMTAAVALVDDEPLATRNVRDFERIGVRVRAY